MKLLPLLCLLSAGFGPASAGETCNSAEPGVPVAEGEDALLSYDFGKKVVGFHWKINNGKDENTVFFYDNGNVRNPIDQFSGRVEFFKDELDSGNASIKIRNTRLEDSGTYTCAVFNPQNNQPLFNFRLNVGFSRSDLTPHYTSVSAQKGAFIQNKLGHFLQSDSPLAGLSCQSNPGGAPVNSSLCDWLRDF